MLGVILYGYQAEFVSFEPKEENSMLFTKIDQGLHRASISRVLASLWQGQNLYGVVTVW